MGSVNRVYIARLARMLVLGPLGESVGRVRDVVISISIVRQQPRVLGLVVDLATRRSIFIPILRVAAIDPNAVTLSTGSVSLRHFEQRPGEVLAIGQVLDTVVKANDPELPELAGVDVVVTDLGIEQTRTRDWMVTRVAVRPQRRLRRRGPVHVVDWRNVQGLTPSALALPGQAVAQLLEQFEGRKPVDVADAIRGLPPKRRYEVLKALNDDRLADILQELPELDQAEVLSQLGTERSADVLEEMDPDDAADLLGVLNPTDAEMLLKRMDPGDSASVRRLLTHSPDTAGGLMTSNPVVLTPDTAVAEALARARDPDLTAALSSMVFVVRPPTATPTGRYLGCVPLQRLLREAPAELVGGIVDSDLLTLRPETPLVAVTRYLAAYNLVCGPVVDDENHLLGAVTVDDLLDHLLPPDWRVDMQELDTAGRLEDWEDPGEQIHGCAPAVHAADIAPVLAAAGSRDRRADHRVDRALLRHRPLPAAADHRGGGVDRGERVRGATALGSLSVHPAEPGILHPGRLRGAADPVGAEPAGEPRPGGARRGPPSRRPDQGRHRVPGPRAGRGAAGRRRGGDAGVPAPRARRPA